MRILIASNSSLHARLAVDYGVMLAKKTGADLSLVHVVRRADDRAEGKAHLEAQEERLKEMGQKARLILRVGLAAEQIVHLAYEDEYDLVVLGEGSAESLIRRLLAPTAERVIANAPCPVLIVKGERTEIGRFLFCHSGQEGLGTLERFAKHAQQLIRPGSMVTMLHVMSQIGASYRVSDWELRAEAAELIKAHTVEGDWLADAVASLKKSTKVNAVPKVRHGLVVDEIMKEIDQGDYDIIVLGAHRRGGWTDILVDDIAKQIIAKVDRPVLVVHGGLQPA